MFGEEIKLELRIIASIELWRERKTVLKVRGSLRTLILSSQQHQSSYVPESWIESMLLCCKANVATTTPTMFSLSDLQREMISMLLVTLNLDAKFCVLNLRMTQRALKSLWNKVGFCSQCQDFEPWEMKERQINFFLSCKHFRWERKLKKLVHSTPNQCVKGLCPQSFWSWLYSLSIYLFTIGGLPCWNYLPCLILVLSLSLC